MSGFAGALRAARRASDLIDRVRRAKVYALEREDLPVANVLFMQGKLVMLCDRTGEPNNLARPAHGSRCRLPNPA